MIIIEGPDNSGKSTLSAKLAKDLGTTYRHSVKPDPKWTPLEALAHSAMTLRPQRVILDRLYAISESIYGPIVRGRSALGDKAQEAILDLYQRPYLVIYCRPDIKTITKKNGRDQMPGVIENHLMLIKGYDEFMGDMAFFSKSQVIYFDWEDRNSYSSLLAACKDHIKRFDQSVWSAFHRATA